MSFFGQVDLEAMVRDLGVDVTINGVVRRAVVQNGSEELLEGAIAGAFAQVTLVTVPTIYQGQIGQTILVGAATFKIRDVRQFGDGAISTALCERQ